MRCLRSVLVIASLFACEASGDEQGAAGTGGSATSTPLLPCAPGTTAACACPGSGTGQQTCDALGMAYGPCVGCAGAGPLPTPTAGTAAAGMDGTGGSGVPDAGTPLDPDAGIGAGAGTGGAEGSGGLGPSCGVGLPILCEPGAELCCVRSLATDTCEPADVAGSCSCDLADCQVLEVRCDGPEDCAAGEVCCGTLSGGSVYVSFECATECRHTSDQRIACHIGGDTCPPTPTPHVCANSQLLTNVQVCIDPATIEQ